MLLFCQTSTKMCQIARLSLKILYMYSRVEWFSTFLDFRKRIHTFLLIKYIFRNSIPKKLQIRPRASASHGRQSFHFQKITGPLKIKIYFWKFVDTFLIHQKTIDKNKIRSKTNFIIIFYFPKRVKLFLICTIKKKKFFWIF